MSKASFFWHDYETWGANPRIDRPAQFAGIRTNQELDIIDEPVTFYCQPTTDFLPQPEAVLITGITPQIATNKGINEAKFFQQIHSEFLKPGSCTVGYNSIRFDDEVTRFGFYRNFIDPYAYSWQNGNSRWDVLDLMRLTHALRPDGINWPQKNSGETSFKLTDLTAANNIEQLGAHDALVDVRATIEMAKLVKKHQPKLFDFYFSLRHKRQVAEQIKLNNPEIILHVSGMFPAQQGCLAPIFPLLANPTNPNEIICYNLRINPEHFLQLSTEQIQQKLYTPTLDLAEGEERIPLKGVHLNKSPALAPVKTLTDQQAEKWQINWDDINMHHQMLMSDSNLLPRLTEVYNQKRDFGEVDTDASLYDGFIGNEDRLRCNQLLAATPELLAEWPAESFQDERLQVLLFRYRARNFPQSLNAEEADRWHKFCHSRLIDGEFGANLTLENFQQQLITLVQQKETDRDQKLLEQLSLWVQGMF